MVTYEGIITRDDSSGAKHSARILSLHDLQNGMPLERTPEERAAIHAVASGSALPDDYRAIDDLAARFVRFKYRERISVISVDLSRVTHVDGQSHSVNVGTIFPHT